MLTILSILCLLFAACALLYQADDRRSAFASIRASRKIRYALRGAALSVFLLTLWMLASVRGWEIGIPIWLGLLSLVFVGGLFLAVQRPSWHASAGLVLGAIGAAFGVGTLL